MWMYRVVGLSAIGVMTVAAAAPEPNVCERIAPQIGLKKVEATRGRDVSTEWRVDTASVGQHLFGGTVATSVRVEPVDEAVDRAAEERRLREMCTETRQGAECALVGPAVFRMGTRRGLVRETIRDGERAIVGIRGTKVYCRAD
jgi:hypothetical protein